MNKFLSKLIFITLIFFTLSSINVFASQKEYWAYTKSIRLTYGDGSAFFVDDNGEKPVYCYNHDYNQPSSSDNTSSNKTYYTRKTGYLHTNDELMNVYGKEKKERIAAVLAYGYPLNLSNEIAQNLEVQCGITDNDAMHLTQQLIWDICNGSDGEYTGGWQNAKQYYDNLLKLSKTTKFEQGTLYLKGKIDFIQRDGSYSTNELYTTGTAKSFSIANLPANMEVLDWNTDKVLNNQQIEVGKVFYIKSKSKPNSNLKLKINCNYNDVKFYFYEYLRGGIKAKPDKPYQSLLRAEVENKINEKPYEISINGNFVPVETTGSVRLTKKDAQSGNPLKDAIFSLRNENGSYIKTNLITDENGQVFVDGLAEGEYNFIETKSPNGYELDKTPVNFHIKAGQKKALEVEKFNKPILLDLRISKVDRETGKALKGAEFEIFSEINNTIPLKFNFSDEHKNYELSNKGSSTLKAHDNHCYFTMDNLKCGDYILKEVNAPSGYELSQDIYIHLSPDESYYKVGKNGDKNILSKNNKLNLYMIKVKDKKGIILPNTGGGGVYRFYKISYFLISIALIAIFIYKNLMLRKDDFKNE